jgi:hypothetical protein
MLKEFERGRSMDKSVEVCIYSNCNNTQLLIVFLIFFFFIQANQQVHGYYRDEI